MISSSGREDLLLLLLLPGLLLAFRRTGAAWKAIMSCDRDCTLWPGTVGGDMLAGTSNVEVTGVYGSVSGNVVI